MFKKVRDTFFKSLKVFVVKVCFSYAAVVFKSSNCSNKYNCLWFKTLKTALDIDKFLCTKVSTETSLCNYIISNL